MEIAKEKKRNIPWFERSEYANGQLFQSVYGKRDDGTCTIVKKALGNVPLITKEMWKN